MALYITEDSNTIYFLHLIYDTAAHCNFVCKCKYVYEKVDVNAAQLCIFRIMHKRRTISKIDMALKHLCLSALSYTVEKKKTKTKKI